MHAHHHSTGSSVLELVTGLVLLGLSAGALVYVLGWVKRSSSGSAGWRFRDRQIGFPVVFLVIGIVLTAKGISGL